MIVELCLLLRIVLNENQRLTRLSVTTCEGKQLFSWYSFVTLNRAAVFFFIVVLEPIGVLTLVSIVFNFPVPQCCPVYLLLSLYFASEHILLQWKVSLSGR